MPAREKVDIIIAGNSKIAQKAVKQTTQSLKRMKTQTAASGGALTAFKAQWVALAAAVYSVVRIGRKVVEAYAVQEKAERTLAAAMQQAGTFTQQAFEHNLKYASSLQKLTAFGDENILTVQKMLTNFGVEGVMLDKLTKATLDLAAAKGMDLKAASDLVAKSVGSTTNALSRYGIQVEGATGSTERMQMAADNITKLFGGAAKAEANTFSGAIAQMNNVIGDTFERIALLVVPLIKDFSKWVKAIAEDFIAWSKTATGIKSIEVAVEALGLIFTVVWEGAIKPILLIFKTFIVAIIDAIKGLIEWWEIIFDSTLSWEEKLEKMGETATTTFNSIKTEVTDTVNKIIAGQVKMLNKSIKVYLAMTKGAKKKDKDTGDSHTKMVDKMSEELKAFSKKVKKMEDDYVKKSKSIIESTNKMWTAFFEGAISGVSTMETIWEDMLTGIITGITSMLSGELMALAKVYFFKGVAATASVVGAAAAPGYYAAAAGLTVAAGVIKAMGGTVSKTIKAAAEGADFITESPQLLLVGEAGKERVTVTPETEMGEGIEGSIIVENMTVIADSPTDFGNQMSQFALATGSRISRR